MAREWQKKRRNSTIIGYLSFFYLSSVINRQGQTTFRGRKLAKHHGEQRENRKRANRKAAAFLKNRKLENRIIAKRG